MIFNENKKPNNGKQDFELTTEFVIKVVLGVIFYTLTFILSNTLIFKAYPFLNVPFLGEFILALALGLFGFHTVPLIFFSTKRWIEAFIQAAVSNIVWDFWEQQSKRMQTARRRRQKDRHQQSKKRMQEKYEGGLVIDTSILIDGRIINIAKAGFFPGTQALVINSVINELHALSDSSDDLKRQKGRRGLDNVEELKKVVKTKVIKEELGKKDSLEVDKRLLFFAKSLGLRLMTLDFNLNKVARTQNITVLNLNELAESIKPEMIPGEKVRVKIVQKGKSKKQGVAYLADGTMIVVEDGEPYVGDEVDVEVSRLIQSPAGKMIFTKLSN